MAVRELIDKLNCEKKLSHDEWVKLIKEYVESDRAYAAELARGISCLLYTSPSPRDRG